MSLILCLMIACSGAPVWSPGPDTRTAEHAITARYGFHHFVGCEIRPKAIECVARVVMGTVTCGKRTQSMLGYPAYIARQTPSGIHLSQAGMTVGTVVC